MVLVKPPFCPGGKIVLCCNHPLHSASLSLRESSAAASVPRKDERDNECQIPGSAPDCVHAVSE